MHKNLLFINQTLGSGGAETFDAALLAELQREHSFTVSAWTNNTYFLELLQKSGISAHQISPVVDIIGDWKGLVKGAILWPFLLRKYYKILSSAPQPDLILLSGFIEKILVTPLAYWRKIPVVWIEFGPISPLFKKFLGLPRLLYTAVATLPRMFIVPSHFTRSDIVAEVSSLETRLIVIPCGVHPPALTPKNKRSSKRTLVCISRMEAGKGQELLVQAMPRILAEFPKTRLIFVGAGDHSAVVSQTIAELKLEHSIELVGFVKTVVPYLEMATVCVFPSVWSLEGFGMVMIEAHAMAKPVVAFRRGPAVEVIQDLATGLLAEPGSVNDLAEKILQFMRNPKLQRQLGTAAQRRFMKEYHISAVAKRYATALHTI